MADPVVTTPTSGDSTSSATTTATSTSTTSASGTEPAKTGATDGATSTTTTTTSAATGAPEKYADWKLADGVTLSDEQQTEFSTYAKSLNLTQDQAQKHLDRELKIRSDAEATVVSQQKSALTQLSSDWQAATKADKDIGGDKLQATLATAVKARDAFGSPELIKMLNESGMGNHPEVVRFFSKVGAAMSEDKHVQGNQSAASNSEEARLRRMYPSMFK